MQAAAIRHALVRCPNWLGDTVMALPTLRALADLLPAAEIWCEGPWAGPLLGGEPGIARCLDVPRGVLGALARARAYRRTGVDLVVLLTNSLGTALMARLAGARWRVGYAGEGRAGLLTHALPPPATAVHQVTAYFGLLAPLGLRLAAPPPPRLTLDPGQRAAARRLLAEVGVTPGAPAMAIALGGALGPSKRWPADRVAALARDLDSRGPVVFLGSGADLPVLRAVTAAMPAPPRSLVGRDHPALLPELLAEFRVAVAADTGLAHLAAAVGVPVVALFGPTDPRLTAPLSPGATALWRRPPCAPCFRPECPIDHRCMTAITVAEVREAVLARLGAS